MNEKALRFLAEKPVLYTGMAEVLRRGLGTVLYAESDGVLLREKEDEIYMLASSNEAAAARILAPYAGKHAELAVAHEAYAVPLLQSTFGLAGGVNACYAAAYLHSTPLPVCANVDLRQLDRSFLPVVMQHYHLADDEAYIAYLLNSGVVYGAFVGGEIAGFIGQHGEGSMGLLEVLPAYQRRGLATALEADAVNRTLAKGQVPFCDVFCDNAASLALQKKLGLTISTEMRWWIS